MKSQIALQLTMQEIEIILIVDGIELSGKSFEGIEIVFASFALDTIEIGGVIRYAKSLSDMPYTSEKKFDLWNDLLLKVSFCSMIREIVHRLLLSPLFLLIIDAKNLNF